MLNEGTDIVQEQIEDMPEWKAKAKVAGTAAVDATKAAYSEIQEKTIAYSQATDRKIRENPYMSIGIALGAGLLLGMLLTGGRGDSDED